MAKIFAGSYESFLFGFDVEISKTAAEQSGFVLRRSFENPAHKGSVKCVAAAGPFVASGGADDTIHLYNIQAGMDLGFLMNPGEGAVTAVQFHCPAASSTPSHLLSGAADGSITIWHCDQDWACLKNMDGHKRAITGLAIHPSGRLALSTGFDATLRMWNLVKGKPQFKTRLGTAADAVSFCPTGAEYALLQGRRLSVHSVEGCRPAAELYHSSRQLCMAYLDEHAIWAGAEDGTLLLWDTRMGTPARVLSGAHSARVRGVSPIHMASGPVAGNKTLLASAASDGVVRVWDGRMTPGRAPVEADGGTCTASVSRSLPLCEASTSARLTCLAVLHPHGEKEKKRRKKKAPAGGASHGVEGSADPPGETGKDAEGYQDKRERGPAGARRGTGRPPPQLVSTGTRPGASASPGGKAVSKKPMGRGARPDQAPRAGAQPGQASRDAGRPQQAFRARAEPEQATRTAAKQPPAAPKGVVRDGVVDFTAEGEGGLAGGPQAKRKKKKKEKERKKRGAEAEEEDLEAFALEGMSLKRFGFGGKKRKR